MAARTLPTRTTNSRNTEIAATSTPLAPADPSFNAVGSMAGARYFHTATLLNNGKVLIAGGTGPVTGGFGTTKSAELYDPATGTFTSVSDMISDRDSHTATLLPNGKVLIAGGVQRTVNGNTFFLDSAELFDPQSGTFTAAGTMNTARQLHTATLLRDGKVLIVGGDFASTNATNNTAELFDPATGTFTLLGSLMTEPRSSHTATLLQDGKVLLAGGYHLEGPFATGTNTAELFDPSSGMFGAVGSTMTSVRYEHTATLLANGKVLIAGGSLAGSVPFLGSVPGVTNVSNTGELFDPSSGTFTAISPSVMSQPRTTHTATLLPNGKVLLTGGYNGNISGPFPAQPAWNNSADQFDPASNTFTPSSAIMTSGRSLHTATLLTDGRVLIAGGYSGRAVLNATELFDYSFGSFAASGSMNAGRLYHTATQLPNGKILIAGGTGAQVTVGAAELFDPEFGTFSVLPSAMNWPRYAHTATSLGNGKVLIAGGLVGTTLLDLAPSDKAELFDPGSGTFVTLPAMTSVRSEHSAALLANGKVLIVGGYKSATYLESAELFDPSSGAFAPLSHTLSTERHGHTATLLPNGKVLIAGGEVGMASLVTNTAEVFDPITEAFTLLPNTMAVARAYHTATLLPNGKVLLAGGFANGAAPNYYTDSAELFDPASNSFTTLPPMNSAHSVNTATLLATGKVLIAGGVTNPAVGQGPTNMAEVFDPVLGTFTSLSPNTMVSARENHTATLLPNGQLLICGGLSNLGLATAAEVFDSGLGFSDARRPVIANATDPLLMPASLVLTGTRFRGDSETGGGWPQSSATNFPIVQLMRIDSDQVFFPLSDPATNWSDTTFSSETLGTTSTRLPVGQYRVTVFTNAIPSLQKIIAVEGSTTPEVPLTSVVSRRAHGNIGVFDVPLPAAGPLGIECRSGGANGDYTIIFTFGNTLSSVDGASVSSGIATVSSSWMSGDMHQYIVNLTGVANAQVITVSLTNVTDSVGNFSSAVSASMGVLLGDVNGNRLVNSTDASLTQAQSGQPVTTSNFRMDINANGLITSTDASIVQAQSGTGLP